MKKKRKMPFFILLSLLVLLCFGFALAGLERDQKSEGKQQLESVLRRTAATCYAAEGFYPPSLAYMQEHYGLRYDGDRYVVYYDIFASNLMPSIMVLEN